MNPTKRKDTSLANKFSNTPSDMFPTHRAGTGNPLPAFLMHKIVEVPERSRCQSGQGTGVVDSSKK